MDTIIIANKRVRRTDILCLASILILWWCVGCREASSTPTGVAFVKDEEIIEINFREYEKYNYIIKFSNVWYDQNNLFIKIPIYGGKEGDVRYSQLQKKRKHTDGSIFTSIIIETPPGSVKKSILECIQFYKKSLLEKTDIKKPTRIGYEGGMWITYDFDYSGYPGTLIIRVAKDENCKSGKFKCRYENIYDIEVDEKAHGFGLGIEIGSKSRWRRAKEAGDK